MLEFCDVLPMRIAAIVLLCCARVKSNHCDAFVFCSLARVEERCDVVIDANAELASDGNTKWLCSIDCCSHDGAREIAFYRNSSTATFPSDLVRRTTKVHVDVISNVLFAQRTHCTTYKVRITSVNLQTTEVFIGAECHHFLGLFVAVH